MFNAIVTDVFFDLDHTLWDFDRNSGLTFQKILAEHEVKVDLNEFLKAYAPINQEYWKLYREEKIAKAELRHARLKKTFDILSYDVSEALIDILATEYIRHLSSFNHLFPNTVEILNYLRPKYRLHIITNGFKEVQEKKLRNSNIIDYFDQIVNSEMAGVKKPNPIIFELALKRAGINATNALMIGDNIEADVMGALAVGFHTLHFNPHNDQKHEVCHMIHDLSEIKTFL